MIYIPIQNCDFHSKVWVYQKVSTKEGCMRMRIEIDTCSFFWFYNNKSIQSGTWRCPLMIYVATPIRLELTQYLGLPTDKWSPTIFCGSYNIWLVVLTSLKNMSSSMGRIIPYKEWKKNMFETTNQTLCNHSCWGPIYQFVEVWIPMNPTPYSTVIAVIPYPSKSISRFYFTIVVGLPHPTLCWLGGWPTPLKNMSSSVGMMTFPIYGKS